MSCILNAVNEQKLNVVIACFSWTSMQCNDSSILQAFLYAFNIKKYAVKQQHKRKRMWINSKSFILSEIHSTSFECRYKKNMTRSYKGHWYLQHSGLENGHQSVDVNETCAESQCSGKMVKRWSLAVTGAYPCKKYTFSPKDVILVPQKDILVPNV